MPAEDADQRESDIYVRKRAGSCPRFPYIDLGLWPIRYSRCALFDPIPTSFGDVLTTHFALELVR